ncbi:MAG: guanylate kinase [Oscillospiraceae bacterium]|nr:guanylate kinase [Oscillospiraceae bacterium]
MAEKGLLLVVSGPSGAGKSTVLNEIMALRQDMFFSVSATTRRPRGDEKNGVHYHFVTRQEFLRMRDMGELLEWAEFAGEYYGTPAAPVIAGVNEGRIIVLDIEINGAMTVMGKYPGAVSIFLTPSSLNEVERRLSKRGSETQEVIARRMKINEQGYCYIDRYTYIVVNDQLQDAVSQMQSILIAEQSKPGRMPKFFAENRKVKEGG